MTPEAEQLLQEIEQLYRQLEADFTTRTSRQTPAYRDRVAAIRIVVDQFNAATKET